VAVLGQASAGQTLAANTPTIVLWPTALASQSTNSTGLTYAAGVFTNSTSQTLPLLIEYAIFLNIAGTGSTYVAANGVNYAVRYNTDNAFTNSYTILLPAAATLTVYYTDTGTPTIQTTSTISITLLTAGAQGPTGPAGSSNVSTLSYSQSTQSSPATQSIPAGSTGTIVLWGAVADATQSQGTTNLTYNGTTSVFTNNSAVTLPILFEYSLYLNQTGGGASFIGVTVSGTLTQYGTMFNENNSFSNSFTVLLPPAATAAVYYMDNLACTIQTSSRVRATLLAAGPQGSTGPVGQVSMVSYVAGGSQALSSSTLALLTWPTQDSTQSVGSLGLSYAAGQFTNTTSSALPLLVEYAVFLNTTMGGYTVLGVNGSTTTYGTPYGGMYTTTNGFNNSYTVLLPVGATLGVYYTDNGSPTVQSSSRVTITLLMAGGLGPQGPTGANGVSAASVNISVQPNTTQNLSSSSLTAVLWGSTDATQSTMTLSAMGLNYASGLFTNTTTTTMTLLVEYSIFLNVTGGGYTVIGINGTSNVYGGRYNDNVAVTNSFTILLAAGATFGVYYMDNSPVQIQTTSRMNLTMLVAGPQGPTGNQVWGTTGAAAYYTQGNVFIGTGPSPANLSVIGTINNMTVGPGTGTYANNTLVGTNTLPQLTTGQNNMAIGYNAGYTPAGFTGSNNIYLGASVVPSSGAATNEIVIGQGATGFGSNTVTIGNAATVSTTLFGSVRNLTYQVTVSGTGSTAVIPSGASNVLTAAGSGIWLVSANAPGTSLSAGVTLSAVTYLSIDVSGTTNTNAFGTFSSSTYLSLAGGNGTSTTGNGLYLNTTNASANAVYTVNLLKIN